MKSQGNIGVTGAFAPEDVKRISQAFDEAWATIEGSFEEHPKIIASARSKLADAILSEAAKGTTNLSAMKTAAIEAFAKEWQRRGTLPKVVL